MRQGWIRLASVALVTFAVTGLAFAAPAKGPSKSGSATASKSLRQYSGWVTALDKASITVEKRGKKPESKTFVKHDEMRTTGDVAKDVHVTVYYRDEGGRAIAHRVVVKPLGERASR